MRKTASQRTTYCCPLLSIFAHQCPLLHNVAHRCPLVRSSLESKKVYWREVKWADPNLPRHKALTASSFAQSWRYSLFICHSLWPLMLIRGLPDSCQIVELRPNPSFFVWAGWEGVGWGGRTKSGSRKTCGSSALSPSPSLSFIASPFNWCPLYIVCST